MEKKNASKRLKDMKAGKNVKGGIAPLPSPKILKTNVNPALKQLQVTAAPLPSPKV